ncbi:MAG: glycosyltransferase [Alphaproteobacteria bacterium]|nr:glycosyltransferase [Alphaproteobacteria bacterium]
MRVAFYAPLKPPDHPVPSGDRRVARLLLKAIRRAGHKATIASRLRARDGGANVHKQEQIRRRGERLAERFIYRHRNNPPDLWFTYHLYHKAPDWLGPTISKAFSVPYIVAEASVAPKQAEGPWAMGHKAVCDAVRGATRILVMNPDDAECLEPLVTERNRLIALPPFIDTKPARYKATMRPDHREALAARFGIDAASIWITVTAMMRPGDKLESYQVLGRAMRQLQGLPIAWLIAGDGPARDAVEATLKFPNTVFLGALDRAGVDTLHAAADIAVWPAIREAFGMALLEAQAAGLPVVAGASPGVAQIVANGDTGLLTPSGDDTMLAEAVRRLVDAPALRREMGKAAMRKAEEEHDMHAATRRIDQALRDAQKAFAA